MSFTPVAIPLAVLFGFLVGVVVNLIADYLPAQRHYHLARTSPFASRSAVPRKPTFLPHRAEGENNERLWPVPLWSGVIAALAGAPVYEPHQRTRHIVIEIGMALVFGWIVWTFAETPSWPFLLFYAAVLILIAIIDVEYRWVFSEIVVLAGLVALFEAAYSPRVRLDEAISGGVHGLLVMLALYLLGIVFARLIALFTGRRVGRTVLGFGDVYIGALGGLILGWNGLWFALFIMILTGAVASLGFMSIKIIKTGRYRVFSAIPYGPYIVIGIAAMLYIPQIVDLVLRRVMNWPF